MQDKIEDCNCRVFCRAQDPQSKSLFSVHRSEVYLVNDLSVNSLGDNTAYICSYHPRKSWRNVEYPVYRLDIRKFDCHTFSKVELYPLMPWMQGVTLADFISELDKNYLVCKHRQIILTKDQYNYLYLIQKDGNRPLEYLKKIGFTEINEN